MHYGTRGLWRPLASALLVVAALVAGGAGALAQDARTVVTVQVDGQVPIANVGLIGVLTYDLNCESASVMAGTWEFDGTINGQPAYSSGSASGGWDGDSLNMTLETLDTWDMPGVGRPATPVEATATGGGAGLATMTFNGRGPVPAAIQPAISNPCDGGATSYMVTAAGSGDDEVAELPNTGAAVRNPGAGSGGAAFWSKYLAALGLAGAASALGVRLRSARRVP